MSEQESPNESVSNVQEPTDLEELFSNTHSELQKIKVFCEESELQVSALKTKLNEQIEALREDIESDFGVVLRKVEKDSEQKLQELGQLYENVKETISNKSANIEELKSSFESKITAYTTRADEKNESLTKEQDKISEKIESLTKTYDECLAVGRRISQIKEESDALKNSVVADIESIKQSNAEFSTLLAQSQMLQAEVSKNHSSLQQLLRDAKTNYKEISSLHTELLISEKDTEGKVISESLSEQINALHDGQIKKHQEMTQFLSSAKADVEKFISSSEAEYKNLRQDLEKEIRDLLPGAGAAGLASAYVQAKSRYGSIEYDKAPLFKTKWLQLNNLIIEPMDKFTHFLLGNFSTMVYYVLFLAPLGYMFYHFDLLFKDFKTIELKVLAFKFFLSLPLGFVSWFGFSSIRLNRRLFEEYNHKQRVMELYHSFKQEIDQHGSEEHKKALIAMMISAVQDKPSLAMHKYDQGLEESFRNILSNLGFIPKKSEEF